jgi:hypothetical protein
LYGLGLLLGLFQLHRELGELFLARLDPTTFRFPFSPDDSQFEFDFLQAMQSF